MATVTQHAYQVGKGMSGAWPKIRLALAVFGSSVIFVFLVTNIPGVDFQTGFGDNFLPVVIAGFMLAMFAAVLLKLEWVLGLLLVAAVTVPLSEVTMSGSYNVITSGLLFGCLFRIRPAKITLTHSHVLLFSSIAAVGLYFNAIPLIFDDGAGFHPRLWFYNLSTFLKYVFIGLLAVQSKMSVARVIRWVCWFAFVYALFVIIEAFHIHPINLSMKLFTFYGQRPDDLARVYAFDYYRAAGLAYDPNHAGIKLSIMLVAAIHYQRHFRFSAILIPMILIAVFLTGSRAGAGLTVVAIAVWLLHSRQYRHQLRLLATYLWVCGAILLVCMANHSFFRVADLAADRYIALFATGSIQYDNSLAFRTFEILDINITSFGDRSDDLRLVHSQVARTLRFFGVLGLIASVTFWAVYAYLVRFSYLGVGLVVVLALTGIAKWTFHIEAFVIPVVFVTALVLQSNRTNSDKQ